MTNKQTLSPRVKDITGQKFFHWTAVRYVGLDEKGEAVWLFRCDCGTEKTVRRGNITNTKRPAKSCGCIKYPNGNRRHGHSVHGKTSPTYKTWISMRSRCSNPRDPAYEDYGRRGIFVCDRWMNSFEAFLEDMGERPPGRYTLDRIDNQKGYSPGNCRWATYTMQNNNRCTVRRVTFRGVTQTLPEWCRILGLPLGVIRQRLLNGWSAEQALTIPIQARNKRRSKASVS